MPRWMQDAGELPISGVAVMLQDAAGNPARDINNNFVPNQVTDGSGMYLFTNLKPGVGCMVVFVTPEWLHTYGSEYTWMIRRTVMRM